MQNWLSSSGPLGTRMVSCANNVVIYLYRVQYGISILLYMATSKTNLRSIYIYITQHSYSCSLNLSILVHSILYYVGWSAASAPGEFRDRRYYGIVTTLSHHISLSWTCPPNKDPVLNTLPVKVKKNSLEPPGKLLEYWKNKWTMVSAGDTVIPTPE